VIVISVVFLSFTAEVLTLIGCKDPDKVVEAGMESLVLLKLREYDNRMELLALLGG